MTQSRKTKAFFLRNFVFGVEDSLVSTVGLLSGVAAADMPRTAIILAGVVLIFVEAFSMGVGSFLSEDVAEDYKLKKDSPDKKQALGGVVMFVSYFVAGFIPLLLYLIFEVGAAFWISIIIALVSLFILGLYGGKLSGAGAFKHGMKWLVVGGLAVVLGVIVGLVVDKL